MKQARENQATHWDTMTTNNSLGHMTPMLNASQNLEELGDFLQDRMLLSVPSQSSSPTRLALRSAKLNELTMLSLEKLNPESDSDHGSESLKRKW